MTPTSAANEFADSRLSPCGGVAPEWQPDKAQLYNLASDPVEKEEVAEEKVESVNELAKLAAAQVAELLKPRAGDVVRIYFERDDQITYTDLVFR